MAYEASSLIASPRYKKWRIMTTTINSETVKISRFRSWIPYRYVTNYIFTRIEWLLIRIPSPLVTIIFSCSYPIIFRSCNNNRYFKVYIELEQYPREITDRGQNERWGTERKVKASSFFCECFVLFQFRNGRTENLLNFFQSCSLSFR